MGEERNAYPWGMPVDELVRVIRERPAQWAMHPTLHLEERQGRQEAQEDKYAPFLAEVMGRGIRVRDRYAQPDSKREMLEKYFPGRFKPGKQSLRDYTPVQIGFVFQRIVAKAREAAGQR